MKCNSCGKEIPRNQCIRCGRQLSKNAHLRCEKCSYVDKLNIEHDKKLKMLGKVTPEWKQIMDETLNYKDASCDKCREVFKKKLEWDSAVELAKLRLGCY